MGKTVSDFKEGRIEIYRDRIDAQVTGTEIGQGWFQTRPNPATETKYSSGSLSRCVDKTNPGFHRYRRARERGRANRNLDVGGPFALERASLTMPTVVDAKYLWNNNPPIYQGYQGVYFPSNNYKLAMGSLARGGYPSISSDLGIDRADLRTLGSTAIAKSIPDIPEFSLFRFIGELRAGLPKIPLATLRRERKLRSVGGEYLNVQFGIMPLISDLQKLIEQLSDPALRSAVKHTLNEEHRVRKVLDKGLTSTKRSLTGSEMNTVQGLAGNSGTLELISGFRIWSSISFVYLQASRLDQLLSDLDEHLGGMGAVPSAIDLWNLTSWSWLVDWFVNFNHVITSLSYLGRDGLYMQRGYVMAHFYEKEITHQSGTIYGTPFSTTGVLTRERKYRIAASPFGFGLTWKDFSPFQLSILGALGVSRLRF